MISSLIENEIKKVKNPFYFISFSTLKHFLILTSNTPALLAESFRKHHPLKRMAHVDLNMHQVPCAIRLDR